MSAVIYAAIVVMWAVVLVPMWLRRHDAATESRSVDRFSTAMRTLSRRTTSGPGRRYVVMPRRSESAAAVHVSGAAVPAAPARRKHHLPARSARGPVSLVARRRRLLLGLLGLTFLSMLLAASGVISWPLQFVVDVILVAFCIHLRSQARRAAAVSRQRGRATVAEPAPAAARRPAAAPAVRPAPRRTVETPQPAVARTGTDDLAEDGTWEPIPIPPPTYVLKPPAPAFEADPTYRDPVYVPASEPVAPGTGRGVELEDSDLDDILEHRWAVND